MLSPTSFFNQPIPADAPIDPKSSEYVANLVKQVADFGAGFEYRDWSIPCHIAGPNTPKQKVWLDAADGTQTAKRAAISEVPIPLAFRAAGPWPTGDHAVAIYQPSTDRYWEFHGMIHLPSPDAARTEIAGCTTLEEPGWHCDNAAAIQNASTSPGYFRDNDWPGVTGTHWGCSGSGIFIMPGAIKPEEAQRAYIPHAIRLQCKNVSTSLRWPAQKTDGTSAEATAPQEGMIFKLKASFDVTQVSDKFLRAVCQAAREYGLILTDKAGNVSLKCATQATVKESQSYSTDAWKGPEDKFGGAGAILSKAATLLGAEFPWSELEVIAESYRPNSVAPGMLGRG